MCIRDSLRLDLEKHDMNTRHGGDANPNNKVLGETVHKRRRRSCPGLVATMQNTRLHYYHNIFRIYISANRCYSSPVCLGGGDSRLG